MSISSVAKLLSGFFLFVALARLLGPGDFGTLMYTFSMASLSVLLVDYGFSTQILKEVGARPDRVKEIMGEFLIAKLFLAALLIVISIFASEIIGMELVNRRLYQLMIFAAICRSFGDFLNVAFRGLGCFDKETKTVSIGLVIHFCIVITATLLTRNLLLIAFGFIMSRIIYLFISWRAYHCVTGGFLYPHGMSMTTIPKTLREGAPFAADVGLVTSFKNIDIILVNYFLGPTAVGIYKAGMNLVRGLESFAQILANVYLPLLSKSMTMRSEIKVLTRRFNIQVISIGAVCALLLVFGGRWITAILYGNQFSELSALWTYFSLFVLFRFIAVTQGVLLTANGLQHMRVRSLAIVFFIFVLISPAVMSFIGLSGMILSQLVVVTLLMMLYVFILRARNALTGFSPASCLLGITTISLILTRGLWG